MTTKNYRSTCCNAKVKAEGIPDFVGSKEVSTVSFVCCKCGKPCDAEITEFFKVSVNDDVEVRLTKEGRRVYKEYCRRYRYDLLQRRKNSRWARIQLSDFMEIFGLEMYQGAPAVIVDNTIRISNPPKFIGKQLTVVD